MCRIDFRALAMATIISAACGIPDETLAPPLAPVIPPPPEALGRLELNVDTKSLFVGMKLRLHISAYGVWGRRMNSEDARVSSSNEAIVKLSNADIIQITFPASGVTTREKAQNLSLVGTGTAVLRVSLGNVTDSVVVLVRALPPASQALVVDSFTVIEYREVCAFDCPYLVYAPLLRLREPTGNSFADVVAVEFSIPTRTTGWCSGQHRFTNGLSAHLNGIDPYLWSNDMIFVSLSGASLPDGPARARVIVKDANGEYGLLEVTTAIQRMVPNAHVLLPPPTGLYWGCPYEETAS